MQRLQEVTQFSW